MVARISADGAVERDGAQVEIGGNERYLSLCRRHYFEAAGGRSYPR
jgi:thymidine kinase